MPIRLLLLTMLFTVAQAGASLINVYFAGGQSNATEAWMLAAAAKIQQSDPTAVIVWDQHDAQPLREWYTTYAYAGNTGRQQYYLSDFYNPDPGIEGKLEAMMSTLALQDEPVFKGLLWFQGESDQHHPESYNNNGYYYDFLAFIDQLEADFSTPTLNASLAVVYASPLASNLQSIRSQQASLGLFPNMVSHETKDLDRSDGIHLTLDAQQQTGEAMAANLAAIPEPAVLSLMLCSAGLLIATNRMTKQQSVRVSPPA